MKTTYTGQTRMIMNQRIKLAVFIHFLPLFITGKLSLKNFLRFAKRLLFFLSKMKDNKYVNGGNGTKINMYVPAFPNKAFFTACRKVMEFSKKMPAVTVLVSVTSACRFDCKHCYQKLDKGKDADINHIINAVMYLQDHGMAFFNIEGGEPFLVYDRLKKVCDAVDSRSEILINSTGDGITEERLRELKRNGNLMGVMFSLHTDNPARLNEFMGSDKAWSTLEKGIEQCHRSGVPVTFNSCLMKDDYYNGTFERVMDRAKSFGGMLIQLIKPKPAGAWLEPGVEQFSAADLKHIREKILMYNNDRAFRDFPAIAPMIIDEDSDHFGCTAGGTDRFYINAKGDVQPCEFLNISFGNISEEPFEVMYHRMRNTFHTPGTCWLCEKHAARIAGIFYENKLTSLPLPQALSEEIYTSLEPGEAPDFYAKVEKI